MGLVVGGRRGRGGDGGCEGVDGKSEGRGDGFCVTGWRV